MTRIGVFGWGVVAPKSPNIDSFAANLASAETWLTPFNGFGPDNFLVGAPEFDFAAYRPWIEARYPPTRYRQLTEKLGSPTRFAIAAWIQALGQNAGLEAELKRLDTLTHVYVGTGMGDIPTVANITVDLYHAQRRWDRFWSEPVRNTAFRRWLDAGRPGEGIPVDPATVGPDDRDQAESAWWHFWAGQSPELHQYLAELRVIEAGNVEGMDIEKSKLAMLKHKQRLLDRLQEQWGAPEPPWKAASPNIIWNIHNTPASQISMLGKYRGFSFAPIGACATFGVCLKLAMDAIRHGEAKAVVVGATESEPHPAVVGGMYAGRVLSGDGEVSVPLDGLRGTHISGGSCIWVVGDWDHFTGLGFQPLGMEPLSVGVSNDAHHIITPSREGPVLAINDALRQAGVRPEELVSWDLHATATPGDYLEVENLRTVVPGSVLVTARKGTFGHGMGVGGGWELTAQYLGFQQGALHPTPLKREQLHPAIGAVHDYFVFDTACQVTPGPAGKLAMGVGGVNSCVISRPLPPGRR